MRVVCVQFLLLNCKQLIVHSFIRESTGLFTPNKQRAIARIRLQHTLTSSPVRSLSSGLLRMVTSDWTLLTPLPREEGACASFLSPVSRDLISRDSGEAATMAVSARQSVVKADVCKNRRNKEEISQGIKKASNRLGCTKHKRRHTLTSSLRRKAFQALDACVEGHCERALNMFQGFKPLQIGHLRGADNTQRTHRLRVAKRGAQECLNGVMENVTHCTTGKRAQ